MLSSRHLLPPLVLLAATAHAQDPQGKAELDRASLEPSVQKLGATVRRAVRQAGGDLERQNVRWVLAFSTGHYKSDPLGAQAAREFASGFVNANAVQGDQVTARAWELNVWPHKGEAESTLTIGADARADKARAANLWPTTPAVGSLGGHDTERAAVNLVRSFTRDPGTVLILVTNTAASVGAPGGRLLGTNAPEYQALLRGWTRLGGDATRDGATLTVPYVVKTPGGNLGGELETVVFVPRTFAGAQMGTPGRAERLAQENNAPTPARSGNRGGAGVLLGLLGLAVVGGLIYAASRRLGGRGGRATLRVEGQSFQLADFPNNRVVCVLAGPGFRAEDDTPVVAVPGAPNEKFAELTRVGNDVRVRGTSETFELREVDGHVVTGATTLRLRPEVPDHALEFTGEVRAASGVPRPVTKTVNLTLTQGEG